MSSHIYLHAILHHHEQMDGIFNFADKPPSTSAFSRLDFTASHKTLKPLLKAQFKKQGQKHTSVTAKKGKIRPSAKGRTRTGATHEAVCGWQMPETAPSTPPSLPDGEGCVHENVPAQPSSVSLPEPISTIPNGKIHKGRKVLVEEQVDPPEPWIDTRTDRIQDDAFFETVTRTTLSR
jgi:hypothetical protein